MENSLRNRTVYLVDDDESIRHSLSVLLRFYGYNVRSFSSAESFLEEAGDGLPGIMLLDQRMDGMSGLEFQIELAKRGIELPIIFLSGHGNLEIAVKAIRNGAINFLEKPVKNQILLESVREAFAHADDIEIRNELKKRYASMSTREREILRHVVTGMSSKTIGKLIGISKRTVEVHRLKAMGKMGAKSLPDLVRIFAICQIDGSE